jgi:hypothetical protein
MPPARPPRWPPCRATAAVTAAPFAPWWLKGGRRFGGALDRRRGGHTRGWGGWGAGGARAQSPRLCVRRTRSTRRRGQDGRRADPGPPRPARARCMAARGWPPRAGCNPAGRTAPRGQGAGRNKFLALQQSRRVVQAAPSVAPRPAASSPTRPQQPWRSGGQCAPPRFCRCSRYWRSRTRPAPWATRPASARASAANGSSRGRRSCRRAASTSPTAVRGAPIACAGRQGRAAPAAGPRAACGRRPPRSARAAPARARARAHGALSGSAAPQQQLRAPAPFPHHFTPPFNTPGLSRYVHAYLPKSFDGTKSFPIWVHLHGVFWVRSSAAASHTAPAPPAHAAPRRLPCAAASGWAPCRATCVPHPTPRPTPLPPHPPGRDGRRGPAGGQAGAGH